MFFEKNPGNSLVSLLRQRSFSGVPAYRFQSGMIFSKMQRSAFIPFYENLVKISIIPEPVLERDPTDRQTAVDQIPDDIPHFVFHDQLLRRHSKIFSDGPAHMFRRIMCQFEDPVNSPAEIFRILHLIAKLFQPLRTAIHPILLLQENFQNPEGQNPAGKTRLKTVHGIRMQPRFFPQRYEFLKVPFVQADGMQQIIRGQFARSQQSKAVLEQLFIYVAVENGEHFAFFRQKLMRVIRQDKSQIAGRENFLISVDLMDHFTAFDQKKFKEIMFVPAITRMRWPVILMRKEKMIAPVGVDQFVFDRRCGRRSL